MKDEILEAGVVVMKAKNTKYDDEPLYARNVPYEKTDKTDNKYLKYPDVHEVKKRMRYHSAVESPLKSWWLKATDEEKQEARFFKSKKVEKYP